MFFLILFFLFSLNVNATEYDPGTQSLNVTDYDLETQDVNVSPLIQDVEFSVPEYSEIDNVTFGYLKELPVSVNVGDIYYFQVKLYNLLLTFVWIYVITWFFDLVFKVLSKLILKRG